VGLWLHVVYLAHCICMYEAYLMGSFIYCNSAPKWPVFVGLIEVKGDIFEPSFHGKSFACFLCLMFSLSMLNFNIVRVLIIHLGDSLYWRKLLCDHRLQNLKI